MIEPADTEGSADAKGSTDAEKPVVIYYKHQY